MPSTERTSRFTEHFKQPEGSTSNTEGKGTGKVVDFTRPRDKTPDNGHQRETSDNVKKTSGDHYKDAKNNIRDAGRALGRGVEASVNEGVTRFKDSLSSAKRYAKERIDKFKKSATEALNTAKDSAKEFARAVNDSRPASRKYVNTQFRELREQLQTSQERGRDSRDSRQGSQEQGQSSRQAINADLIRSKEIIDKQYELFLARANNN